MSFLKAYGQNLIGCILLMFICLPTHAGFILILLAPFCAVYAIAQLVTMLRKWKQPAVWRSVGIKLAILLVACLVVVIKHRIEADIFRQRADQLVVALEQYQGAHGTYPSDIAALDGWSKDRLHQDLSMGAYFFNDGKPSLFYADTFMPFTTWDYDFKTHHWEYNPD